MRKIGISSAISITLERFQNDLNVLTTGNRNFKVEKSILIHS